MTWGKVDDKLWGHPKWMAATGPARGLWITALSWCMSQETDGFVPRHALVFLGGTTRHAVSLVAAGLWEASEGGWTFHDWAEYQPDAASMRAKRDAESVGGQVGNHERWHVQRGIYVPECEFCASGTRSGARSGPDRGTRIGGESGANPPGPEPVPGSNSSKRDTGTPRNARRRDEPEPHPEPEFDPKKILAGAGLAQSEVRDFLVDLKANNTRNTTALINALYRDGKLATRIAEWRTERDLATEAASRPAKSTRVAAHADLVQQFAAQEAAANVVPIRQITEGA